MAATFEFWKSERDNQFWFHLKEDGNRKTILASTEGYKNEDGCLKGIDSTKRNSQADGNYQKIQGTDGKYYFTLRAGNYEPVSRSEGYDSSYNRDRGIENCKKEAPSASIKRVSK
ncbi:MAG: YegP family protein [Chitinophagaceae bacterium]